MPSPARSILGAPGAILLIAAGCISQDDARVQTLLNQRGFGTPYVGDANEQYYLGVGDRIAISDIGNPEINNSFQVLPDGTIHVPVIDQDIHVAGLTLPDVGELMTRRFLEFFKTASVEAQLLGSGSKFFYVHGQVAGQGRVPFTGGHTLFDVVFQARPNVLADEDAVRLIRADPVHPLVLEFDYDDMAEGGYSGPNVMVRENDIIFVPPNLLGHVALLLEALLAPLNRVVFSALAFNRLIFLTESFADDQRFVGGFGRGGGRRRFGGFGGFGFGGLYGDPEAAGPPPPAPRKE